MWSIIREPNVGYSIGVDFSEENTELTGDRSEDNGPKQQMQKS